MKYVESLVDLFGIVFGCVVGVDAGEVCVTYNPAFTNMASRKLYICTFIEYLIFQKYVTAINKLFRFLLNYLPVSNTVDLAKH